MNDDPFIFYTILIGLSVLGIFKNSVRFNPIRFHCDNYIFSTYLYFILSWAIALATVTKMSKDRYELNKVFTGPFMVMIFLCSILLLMGIMMLPNKFFLTRHVFFILKLILIGVTLYPLYVLNKERFNHVAITTLLILTILSILVFINPNLISDNIVTYLFIGLLGVVIARLVELFIVYKSKKPNSEYSKILNYIVIILFSLYIMYDTKTIIKNSKDCRLNPFGPDFIQEAINLFLDSLNMFSGIYHVRND